MVFFDGSLGKIVHDKSQFHFLRFGSGPKTLLAFHGFGLIKESFLIAEQKLGNDYTIYSFDLFFHGSSTWNHKDRPISKLVLKDIISEFLQYFSIQDFSLITYSLGGKLGLTIAELFSTRIEKLILIASDGFVLSKWYKLATGFQVTRQILKYFVYNPKLYFTLTQILSKLKLIPHATIRFAEMNMSTRSMRGKVYYSWVVFRKLQVDTRRLCLLLNENDTKVEFYFGDRDFLIPMKRIIEKSKVLNNRTITVLPCSHSKVLIEYSLL